MKIFKLNFDGDGFPITNNLEYQDRELEVSGVEARRPPASQQEGQPPRCSLPPAVLLWRCFQYFVFVICVCLLCLSFVFVICVFHLSLSTSKMQSASSCAALEVLLPKKLLWNLFLHSETIFCRKINSQLF